MIGLVLILIYPLGYSLWLAFHQWTLRTFRQGVPYVGLDNFTDLIQGEDFTGALATTALHVFAIVLSSCLGRDWPCSSIRISKASACFRSLILLP